MVLLVVGGGERGALVKWKRSGVELVQFVLNALDHSPRPGLGIGIVGVPKNVLKIRQICLQFETLAAIHAEAMQGVDLVLCLPEHGRRGVG